MTETIITNEVKQTEAVASKAATLFHKSDLSRYALCKLLWEAQAPKEQGGKGLSLTKVASAVGIHRASIAHPDATPGLLAQLSLDPNYRLSKTGAYNYAKAVQVVRDSGAEVTPESVNLGYKLANQSKVTSAMLAELTSTVSALPAVDIDAAFIDAARAALVAAATGDVPADAAPIVAESDTVTESDTEQVTADTVGTSPEVLAQTIREAATGVAQWSDADRKLVQSAMDALFDAMETAQVVAA